MNHFELFEVWHWVSHHALYRTGWKQSKNNVKHVTHALYFLTEPDWQSFLSVILTVITISNYNILLNTKLYISYPIDKLYLFKKNRRNKHIRCFKENSLVSWGTSKYKHFECTYSEVDVCAEYYRL